MEPDQQNPASIPPAAIAPPTEAVPLASPVQTSSWPTAIGIIAIVFGVGAMLSTVGTLASTKWSSWQFQHLDANALAALQVAQAKWQPWTIATNVAYFALAALLLYGGILLLRRRRSSAGVLRWWSLLKMGFVLVSSAVGYYVTRDMMTAMAPSTPTMPQMGQMQEGFVIFGVLFALAWGWALPVFMLVWFARDRVKQEMSRWS